MSEKWHDDHKKAIAEKWTQCPPVTVKVKELISGQVCMGTYGLVELEVMQLERELAEARTEIERLKKGVKTVQSAFNNYKNADAEAARIKMREAKILAASCSPDLVNSERAANAILTDEIERKDKLIEQMREALKFSLIADEVRQTRNVCASDINDACETSRIKRIAALSAAERGEG